VKNGSARVAVGIATFTTFATSSRSVRDVSAGVGRPRTACSRHGGVRGAPFSAPGYSDRFGHNPGRRDRPDTTGGRSEVAGRRPKCPRCPSRARGENEIVLL